MCIFRICAQKKYLRPKSLLQKIIFCFDLQFTILCWWSKFLTIATTSNIFSDQVELSHIQINFIGVERRHYWCILVFISIEFEHFSSNYKSKCNTWWMNRSPSVTFPSQLTHHWSWKISKKMRCSKIIAIGINRSESVHICLKWCL